MKIHFHSLILQLGEQQSITCNLSTTAVLTMSVVVMQPTENPADHVGEDTITQAHQGAKEDTAESESEVMMVRYALN